MQNQVHILEKLEKSISARPVHRDSVEVCLALPQPEPYRTCNEINAWLALFESYCSAEHVPCELKASYLLHCLGLEIFQIISHCGWPKETFENYHILTEALRQKFGYY